MIENNLTESKIENPTLGKLHGVYYVKFSVGYFLPLLLLFLFPLIGFYIFWTATTNFQKIALLIFIVIFTLPLIFLIWKIVPKIRDELKIYEKGFTYKSLKGLQTCLWSEIKDGSFSQEMNGRNVMKAAVKANGEEIVFAYKMRGLDKVNSFYDDETFRQISEEEENHPIELTGKNTVQNLGELQNVYHTKYGFWQIILHGFVFFPLIFFTAGMFGSGEFLLLIFVIPLSALFFGMLRSSFQDRRDELTIYQNGFTYQSRKGLQTCSWNEINDWNTGKWGKIVTDIRTKKGEWINFAIVMQGLDDLTTKINNRQN